MSAWLANLSVAAAVLLAGLSLLLAVVGFLAYRRVGHGRLGLVSLAFFLFFVQGVLATVDAVQDRADPSLPAPTLLGLATVTVLYLAVLKR
ncbi:MAG: hypothetical protein ACPGQL_04485 [Thermoplasmatota archaeon]